MYSTEARIASMSIACSRIARSPDTATTSEVQPVALSGSSARLREAGLVTFALGLLSLTCSMHPLWLVPGVAFALAAMGTGVRALVSRGERRFGALGILAAVLALAVSSVTVPLTLQGAWCVVQWFDGLRH
ncbi:hypothetical protein C5D35_01555 [Rathayibacter toxicus]|nr:hypothetical protein C5D35_01555 [Rathayibacter toxicus]